jgi:hypothetical protein
VDCSHLELSSAEMIFDVNEVDEVMFYSCSFGWRGLSRSNGHASENLPGI